MAVSTRSPGPSALVEPERRDVGREFVYEAVFRVPAGALVPPLARLRVPPPAVVLANATAGLAAAVVLLDGRLLLAALLLQVKTLLDNVDGSLARATRSVTLAGRYLDTEADFVVNAALFAALASATGAPVLALASFAILTFLLSVNFEVRELHRAAWSAVAAPPPAGGGRFERALERVYGLVFAPQDRLVRRLSEGRLARLGSQAGRLTPERIVRARQAYYDRPTIDLLANLGLSTQLAVLGVCLALGRPELYLWLVLASLGVLAAAQIRRERRARKALAR